MQTVKTGLIWLIYLSLAAFALMYMNAVKNSRIDAFLDAQTKNLQNQYETIYHSFSIASKNVYLSLQDNEKLLELFYRAGQGDTEQKRHVRQQMRHMLAQKYKRMRNFGVEQFHFHLPDAESFLRMHKPQKYGDDLSDVRPGVVLTNKTKTMQEGFEIGRVVHGFRFIYPLSRGSVHLGSVEISMSGEILQRFMAKSFQNETGIMLHETMATSNLWPKDLQQKYSRLANNPAFFISGKKQSTPLPQMQKRLLEYNAFSLYDKDSQKIFSFKPIRDITGQNTGYIYSVTSGAQVAAIYRDYYTVTATVSIFLLLIAYLIYRDQKYKRTLYEKIEQKSRQLHQKHQKMMQQTRLAQMGEMINMIAHQWRQPLSAIASTANSLQLKTSLESFDKTFFQSRLEKIAYYTQNLSATVDDFRNFFKPHKEMVEITPEKICDDAVFIIEISLNNNHITLRRRYDCYQKIQTYPSEIRQVILNLLKNSEDAIVQNGHKDGFIEISTTILDRDFVQISVADSGGGIDPQNLDKIFDPYFSTKDVKVGTGIGLYMSNMIVSKHCGGKIEAANTDSGACFTVTLPREMDT